jgi:trans-2,3-dihydro-3-hydroxyanthranilate isomerase
MSHPLHIVDVFAETPYAGNQLAVVLDAGDIPGEKMQDIAREMNFSETTFVLSGLEPDGGYRVRIFTPSVELPFAGHPTLGTAWIIRRHVTGGDAEEVRLNLPVGQIPVGFESSAAEGELVWLTAPPIEAREICDRSQIARALQLAEGDIEDRTPVQQLHAGAVMTIVPIRSLDALRRAKLDLEAFAPLAAKGFNPYLYLFCPEPISDENDLCARFFFEVFGLREDPATGSAAAMLGAYLLEHDYFPEDELSLRIEQGYEIDRPSLLRLRAKRTGEGREIAVGGRVIPIAEGRLL